MPVAADLVVAQWAIQCPRGLDQRKERSLPFLSTSGTQIIDIRRSAVEVNLKEDIHALFQPKKGPRQLPTLLLYDEKGLQLFEEITYLDEYYLTNDEIELLKRSSAEMAEAIPSGSMVIELGSGNLRKVILLLEALEKAGKSIDYYALDLSRKELERTLAHVPDFRHVRCRGLHGTYDDGREWLRAPENVGRQKCLLHLGSSIGNFPKDEAAAFLRSLADVLGPSDMILLGLDACQDPAKVYHAYNDREGVTHRFILNGLTHANRILGKKVFNEAEWRVVGEYVFDQDGGRHQAFYSPLCETAVLGAVVKPHERIQVEQSVKYSRREAEHLWSVSGLQEVQRWTTGGDEYGLHLLAKANMPFSLAPSVYAGSALPSLADWKVLWDAWDVVSRGMLPSTELMEKPIRLRNACIFYLGHIPAFLDVQLTKRTGEALTEPAWYKTIFERGIDPDVDNPEHCHDHSEIPAEWPPVEAILQYQERVRARLEKMYLEKSDGIPRSIGQAIWVGFEHELMHIETLLYMMLHSDKTLPPPIAPRPNFEKLAERALAERVENEWFTIPHQQVTIGMDEPEAADDSSPAHHFGWDNEKPARQTTVHAFQAQGRPITNQEYARYMHSCGITKAPAAWSFSESVKAKSNCVEGPHGSLPNNFVEGMHVRTVYGLVPLKYALDWPVFASYDELAGCAAWLGGRIPSFEEARSIYHHVRNLKQKEAERTLGRTVPAVNGHLLNNGVQETPPTTPPSEVNEECRQLDLFDDLDGANVGFQHWHPVPVTSKGNRLAGQSEMGGVWEWTSTVLERYNGFQPMNLYPGYTADFFDGKHNIVLGGSWATHPRIAGRKSFINWYQRNYPFAWAGARLVRDLEC